MMTMNRIVQTKCSSHDQNGLGDMTSRRLRTMKRRPGSILVAVIVGVFFIVMLGLSLADVTSRSFNGAVADYNREQALSAADAGVDYTIAYMNLNNNNFPGAGPFSLPNSHATFTISGPTTSSRYPNSKIVTCTGASGSDTVTVVGVIQTGSSSGGGNSAWSNAIYAKGHQTDVTGNAASVTGSVTILGQDIANTASALHFEGGAYVFNNYDDFLSYGEKNGTLDTTINTVTPPLSKDSNGKSTLHANVAIANGKVLMGNGARFGWPNSQNGATDHTNMDGVFVGSGLSSFSFGASGGSTDPTTYIFSDNGDNTPYSSAPTPPPFPDIVNSYTYTDPSTHVTTTYADYLKFINAYAYQYNGDINIGVQQNVSIPSGATATGSGNYLIADSTNKILYIHGIIQASGNIVLNIDWDKYTVHGAGTLVAGGSVNDVSHTVVGGKNIYIGGQFVIPGPYTNATGVNGFPNNAIGLLAPDSLYLGQMASGSNPVTDVPGACYAENFVQIGAECHVLGSIVTNDFNFGRNGGVIEVPALSSNLPFGVPGVSNGTATATLIGYYRTS